MTDPHPHLSVVPYDHPDAHRLMRQLHAEQISLYGYADDPSDTPAAEFAPPRGLFLLARIHPATEPVACGGWHLIDSRTAEIKRMYVQPEARGLSLGQHLLTRLEHDARHSGTTRILLETGVSNTAALALYHSAGYSPVPSYRKGRNPSVNRALHKLL
ncbi:GNAT family N-acetyltransferase [Streptomyces sp. CAU 1734]|uniref:GNAT family N-acetyltransferase n=1 Tax=Streptomyces sp. CAU 1734 TaxID=3140360 RepID=UPI00325FF61D